MLASITTANKYILLAVNFISVVSLTEGNLWLVNSCERVLNSSAFVEFTWDKSSWAAASALSSKLLKTERKKQKLGNVSWWKIWSMGSTDSDVWLFAINQSINPFITDSATNMSTAAISPEASKQTIHFSFCIWNAEQINILLKDTHSFYFKSHHFP